MINRLRISAGFYFYLAVLLLILPLKWMFAIIIAAVFHEFCHLLAIRLCGRKISRLEIRPFSANMEVSDLTRGQECICAAAGPAGSLALLAFLPWFPRLAVCAALHGIYNLLPLYPLDGGRILKTLLLILFSPKSAQIVMKTVETILIATVILLVIYLAFFQKMGLLALNIASIFLIGLAKNGRDRD